MTTGDALVLAGLIFTLLSSAAAWITADARGRARLASAEEKLTQAKADHIADVAALASKDVAFDSRIGMLEVQMARTIQDREDLHRSVTRLEDTKASREAVEGIRAELATFRGDMDKRFDRLERLLTSARFTDGQ